MTVFFQRSRGSFETNPELMLGRAATTGGPQSVLVVDLNGDGHLDLVSANHNDKLTLFLGNGAGGFNAEPDIILTGLSGPRSIVSGDLDGDGDLDLISANFDGQNLTVYLQRRVGVFAREPDLTLEGTKANERPVSVWVGDLDGDGKLDLVSASPLNSSLTVYRRRGPGDFGPSPGLTLGDSPLIKGNVATADLDGDGDLDLVSCNRERQELAVFLQMAPGAFSRSPDFTLGGLQDPGWVAAADVDGDGKVDLVSTSRPNTVAVFYQKPEGGFLPEPSDQLTSSSVVITVLPADLNGDGALDLVSGNRDGLNVFFQVFQEGRTAFRRSELAPAVPAGEFVAVVVGEFNGDGLMDLASVSSEKEEFLAFFFQRSPGEFGNAEDRAIGGTSDECNFIILGECPSLNAADLDADGFVDLMAAKESGSEVYFQESHGEFQRLLLGGASGPGPIAWGDLDGDGDLDLAAANPDNVSVFYQRSPRDFGVEPDLTLNAPLHMGALVSADLDGDGDLDLTAAAPFGTDNLKIFFGSH